MRAETATLPPLPRSERTESALETLVEIPLSSLSGVARVLVHAGMLSSNAAEDLAKSARERRISFIGAVIASGAVSAFDLAHTLSTSLALPLVDLSAVDLERLPKGLVDPKLAAQYQLVMLGRRGNRLFIGGADPTDQEAVERIKFATQLSPEWVVVEYDKLARLMETQGASASETLEALTAEDFEFDVTDDAGSAEQMGRASCRERV